MTTTVTTSDEAIDAVFAALSDATRRHLLERMATRGGVTSSEVAAELPITRQAVSRHLGALEASGLARSVAIGRERHYELRPEGFRPAERWIERAEQLWESRLSALKALVEGTAPEPDRSEPPP